MNNYKRQVYLDLLLSRNRMLHDDEDWYTFCSSVNILVLKETLISHISRFFLQDLLSIIIWFYRLVISNYFVWRERRNSYMNFHAGITVIVWLNIPDRSKIGMNRCTRVKYRLP